MLPETVNDSFAPLPSGPFGVILADPPWRFQNWSMTEQAKRGEKWGRRAGRAIYDTMRTEDICRLPVRDIAARDCVLFLWATYPKLPEALQVIEAWGFCVSPDTRVLTADLRWVPAEELSVGDRLLGFDENHRARVPGDKGRRYFDWSEVLSTGIEYLESYEVVLEDGAKLRCSADHPWLARGSITTDRGRKFDKSNWMRAKEMAETLSHPRRRRALSMIRVTPVATPRADYKAGFLSAAFDAEGSLNTQHGPVLSFAQNPNPFLSRVEDYLAASHYPLNRYITVGKTGHVNLRGGMDASLRFLMEMRPPRLLEKWRSSSLEHVSLYNREKVPIEEVRYIGRQAMVTLTTSTGTYIAEGFGAHNTYKTAAFTWAKRNPLGRGWVMGLGYWTRGNPEICLLATRGKPHRVCNRVRNLVVSARREHSRKPDEVYGRIEQLMGDVPRVELFARRQWPGWVAWGLEAPAPAVVAEVRGERALTLDL